MAALDDPDPAARRRAAVALAGRPEALIALLDAARCETDPAAREAELAAVAAIESRTPGRGRVPA